MASTTFSGPVTSTNGFIGNLTGVVTGSLTGTASGVAGAVNASVLILPTSTSTLLGNKAAAVNTTNKAAYSSVYNTTTKTLYVAQGPGATDAWIDTADGSTTITPA